MKPIVIKGWIARDTFLPNGSDAYAFYFTKPREIDDVFINNPKNYTDIFNKDLVMKAGLKKGECKKVEITIKEIKK